MRRKDREVTEIDDILEIIQRCEVCRLALHDQPAPYLVPLSFGWEHGDGVLRLFFHCAAQGRKLDLIARNPQAGFELDGGVKLLTGPDACSFSTEYESVVGTGTVRVLEDLDERVRAMERLMAHYAPDYDCSGQFDARSLTGVCLLELRSEAFTAKRHRRG